MFQAQKLFIANISIQIKYRLALAVRLKLGLPGKMQYTAPQSARYDTGLEKER